MALDLGALHNIQSNRGALVLDQKQPDQVKVIGNGALGKIATLLRNPGTEANKQLKDKFLDALESKYGQHFREAYEGAVNGSSKPLSLKLAKSIVSEGDHQLKTEQDKLEQQQNRISQQNKSTTNVLANAFSSLEHGGRGESPLRTALRGPCEDCGLSDRLKDLTQKSALNADKSVGSFEFKLEHIKLPESVRTQIHKQITAAGDGGKKGVSLEEAAQITKTVIKESGILDRKMEFLTKLEQLPNLTQAQKDCAIDAIVRNDYPSFEKFQASFFRSGPTGETQTQVYGASTKDQTDHSNASLTSLSEGLKNRPYDSSTFDPSAFFSKVTDTGTAKDWSINRSILAHFSEALPKDSPLRNVLDQRAMLFMAKNAVNSQAGADPSSLSAPWQVKQNAYFRGGHEVGLSFSSALAKTLGVSVSNLQLVTDSRVMEVVKRDFSPLNANNVLSWGESDLDKLMEQALSKGGDRILLDVTEFMAGTTHAHSHDADALKEAISVGNSFLHDVIDAHIDDYVERHAGDQPPPTRQELLSSLSNRLVFASTMQVGEQSVLYTRGLGERSGNSYEEGVISYTKDRPNPFLHIANHNGFMPGPNQIIDNWLKTAPNSDTVMGGVTQMVNYAKEIFGTPENVKFPDDLTGLATFQSMNDFRQTGIYQGFEILAQAPNGMPYQTILGSATTALLKGLETMDIHGAMTKEGLEPLLQLSLNKIQASMQKAIALKDDARGFETQISAIHEEVATLVCLGRPLTPQKFDEMMNEVAPLLPKGMSSEVVSTYQMKNSGMRSLSSVLSGLEALKAPGSGLNIACQKDSYYESSTYLLPGGQNVKTFELDGRTLDGSVGTIGDKLTEGSKENAPPQKLDLFVAEFHHNISYDLERYVAEPVKDQVDKLFEKGLVSDKFTVALDVTISRTDAPEIQDFLAHNKDRIESGQLNVVFYRSGQKFDMGGMDNFNGGIMATVNNASKGWDVYNKSVNGEAGTVADKLSDFNLQGLGAYQMFAQKELNAYRQGIVDATSKLNCVESIANPLGMPQDMFATPGNVGKMYLQLADNQDPGAVFLDFRVPFYARGDDNLETFYGLLQGYMSTRLPKNFPDKYQIEARPSFGFPHSNVSIIGASKFRFNPGLESDETLKNYKELFVNLNKIFGETMQDYRDPATFNKINMLLLTSGPGQPGQEVLDVLTQQPDVTKLDTPTRMKLAENLAAVGSFKAAARALDGLKFDVASLSTQARLRYGEIYAETGDLAKARAMIGRLGRDLPPMEARIMDNIQAAIMRKDTNVDQVKSQMTQAMDGLKLAMQDGTADRIVIMGALGKVHDLAQKIGQDPVATMRDLLSSDLKTRTAPQLANIIHVLDEALQGLETVKSSDDPLVGVMRTVKTFAEQDSAIIDHLTDKVARTINIRPRDPGDLSKKHPQHSFGDFASSVSYLMDAPENRRPLANGSLGGGDQLLDNNRSDLLGLANAIAQGPAFNTENMMEVARWQGEVQGAMNSYLAKLPTTERGTRQFSGWSDIAMLLENDVRRKAYISFDAVVKGAYERNPTDFTKTAQEFTKTIEDNVVNLRVAGRMLTSPSFLNSVPPNRRDALRAYGEHFLTVANELARPGGAAQTYVDYAKLVQTDPQRFMAELVPIGRG